MVLMITLCGFLTASLVLCAGSWVRFPGLPGSQVGFSITNFSIVQTLEVGGVTPPCLGKHVKPLLPAVLFIYL